MGNFLFTDKTKKEFIVKVVSPTALYFIKGERYSKKVETIREWSEELATIFGDAASDMDDHVESVFDNPEIIDYLLEDVSLDKVVKLLKRKGFNRLAKMHEKYSENIF